MTSLQITFHSSLCRMFSVTACNQMLFNYPFTYLFNYLLRNLNKYLVFEFTKFQMIILATGTGLYLKDTMQIMTRPVVTLISSSSLQGYFMAHNLAGAPTQ